MQDLENGGRLYSFELRQMREKPDLDNWERLIDELLFYKEYCGDEEGMLEGEADEEEEEKEIEPTERERLFGIIEKKNEEITALQYQYNDELRKIKEMARKQTANMLLFIDTGFSLELDEALKEVNRVLKEKAKEKENAEAKPEEAKEKGAP